MCVCVCVCVFLCAYVCMLECMLDYACGVDMCAAAGVRGCIYTVLKNLNVFISFIQQRKQS